MSKLHQRRFEELFEQLQPIIDSKQTFFDNDPFQRCQREEIEPDALLEWIVKARNLLSKACGHDSEHYQVFVQNQQQGSDETCLEVLMRLRAVFLAAKEDFEGGYLQSTRTLVQAEVFDSELEQSRSLFSNGYFSAAAVVAGVVLETTLRELCDRHKLSHGKLDKMNADLAKQGVYTKLVQKRITTLANIRNSAAHGKSK